MDRRNFLRLLATGVIGHTLDVDKLLWVPGQKKIFIPSTKQLSIHDIIAIEFRRLEPRIRDLFERPDNFYTNIKRRLDD